MTKPTHTGGPPPLTVAQGLVILLLIGFGFLALENDMSLVFLLIATGGTAWLLNRLLQIILWLATRNEKDKTP